MILMSSFNEEKGFGKDDVFVLYRVQFILER